MRSRRALVRLGRDDAEGALADLRRCVEHLRETGGPLLLLFNLARELLPVAQAAPGWAGLACPLALEADKLDIVDSLRDTFASAVHGRWREAGLAVLDGDETRAADLLHDGGDLTLEAAARLRAAEKLLQDGRRHEGQAQLDRALAFYRSVGATAYLRRGEKLLAASA